MTADTARVIVTGSRTWTDYEAVRNALWAVWVGLNSPRTMFVVHGANPRGADNLADQAAVDTPNFIAERHPAEWERYGSEAGPIRNQSMVNHGADLGLAFVNPCVKASCRIKRVHPSHGSRDCMERMVAARIKVDFILTGGLTLKIAQNRLVWGQGNG